MIKNKAIEVISTFSESELKGFFLFLESPYFNSNKSLIKLFGEIKKALLTGKTEKITEEYLYVKIFKGKKYNYGIMKNLMSELYKHAEKFIVINLNNNTINDIDQQFLLLGELEQRGLEDNFKNTFGKIKGKIEDGKISSCYYHDLGRLYEAMKDFHRNRSNVKDFSLYGLYAIEYIFPHLLTVIAEEYAMQYAAEHSANQKPQTDLLKEFITRINISDFSRFIESSEVNNKEDILIKLNFIDLLTGSNNDSLYFKLRDVVFKNTENYSNKMLYILFNNYLLLYAEKRASEGSKEFFKEKYDVFKKMFTVVKMNNDGVGYLFLSSYLDTVLSGIRLGETDYVLKFAEDYRKDVDPSVRDVAYRLARAYIFAAEKKYELSLKELSLTEQADFHIKLRTKFLYLKCCFELGLFEQGFSMIDSFKKFITDTRELHPDFRKKLNDSIKAYSGLFKISASPEKYTAQMLDNQASFVKASGINPKDWYLDKLAELKQKYY